MIDSAKSKTYKIAYITGDDPADINAWSGTLYFLKNALIAKGCEVQNLGPVRPVILHYILAAINQISLRIFHKRIDYRHSKIYSKAYAKLFTRKLDKLEYDLVLCVGGSEFVAHLKSFKPLILVVDRTVAGAINYHRILSDLWNWSAKQSIHTDQLAMLNSKYVFFASDWAKDAAITNYRLPKNKAHTLPFGANLNSIPERDNIHKRLDDTNILKLLFIGREWFTKGGPIALQCLRLLRNSGQPAELHVVGCTLPNDTPREGVIEYGFLNKHDPQESMKLKVLFNTCHFFILPTTFEAYGLVFAESAAYGLPSIGPNTGGVASAMAQGEAGILVEKNAPASEYATRILELWNDKVAYQNKIFQARKAFDSKLNWDIWAYQFLETIGHSLIPNKFR